MFGTKVSTFFGDHKPHYFQVMYQEYLADYGFFFFDGASKIVDCKNLDVHGMNKISFRCSLL